MATVRILNNILEDKVDTFSVGKGITIETLIREHTDGNAYDGQLVECYDLDTGETYFAPIEDDTATTNAIVQVNGKDTSLDYVIKENDIVSVIITPAGGGGVDFGPGILGAVVGGIVGGLVGFAIAGPLGAFYGATMGITLGFSIGILVGNDFNQDDGNSSSGLNSEQLPDVRGSQNQPLTDQPYPMVIGKHLVTPFIIGSPWNEISGNHGEDNCIHILYAVAYAPLRLTEFKLGEMDLAHNQPWSGNKNLKNIFHGELSGIDSQAGSGSDTGDIVSTWKNNDISIEILQQGQNGQAVDYGNIYPYAKIQQDIKANVLYIADGSIEEIDSANNISYKGLGLANGLRNNPIRFSEQYADSVKVELDFQNGLYKTRSETSGDNSSVKYYQIPMWIAVQWRVYSVDNIKTDGEVHGVIEEPEWINEYEDERGNKIPGHYATTQRGWHSFTNINGCLNVDKYTGENRYNDLAAHSGNDFPDNQKPTKESLKHSQRFRIAKTYVSLTNWAVSGTNDARAEKAAWDEFQHWQYVSGESFTVDTSQKDIYSFSNISIGDDNYIYFTLSYMADILSGDYSAGGINDGWLDADVFNIQSLGGTNSEQDGINEFRCVTEVNFVKWARENLLSAQEKLLPEAKIEKILTEKFKAYFYDSSNTAKSIEIRVVRVSPCYLDETVSTKKHSAYKFNDVFTWATLTSTMLDGDKLVYDGVIERLRPISEDRMRKLCVIALKAKTDNVDQLSNTLKKFSCIAQSFAPYYNDEEKKWLPEKISTTTRYYKPSYKDENGVWHQGEEITRQQFEEDRQKGIKSLRMPAGNDYVPQIVENVIRTAEHIDDRGRYYIPDQLDENGVHYSPDGTLKYCNNNVASMFLLAGIGPQLGIDALGYNQKFYDENGNLIEDGAGDFNMVSLAKWYKWAEDVTDKSTYSSDGSHYDHDGRSVLHGKGELVHMYFAANAYIYQETMLEQMLAKIAVAGRAVYTRDSKNRLTVVIDKEEKYPVALINQQNTLKSTYTISFADNPSGMQITFPDENDGYIQNQIYCMADGESADKPRAAIEQYKFDYVTNNAQQWSLGRYLLANRLLNKEVVTKQIGAEGASIGLGNLILLQDDTMLIGTDNGGRITRLIENDTSIFGFVIDNAYHYTGEEEAVKDDKGNAILDENGEPVTRCRQGVIVMQPVEYQASRVITLRLAKKNTKFIVNGETWQAVKGNTNTVLFDTPIAKDKNSSDGTDYYVYKPQAGNIVGFGIIGQMTATYRVVKIKPDAKRTFELTLMKYQEDLYSYGAELPSFQNNMTVPDRSDEDAFALSNNVTVADLVRALAESAELAQGKIDDTFGYAPPSPNNLTADVERDCIQFTCTVDSDKVNNIDHITYEITKADGTTTTIDGSYSTEYFFDRDTDGYPEKDSLALWRFRAKAVSIYLDTNGNRYESEWSDYISLSPVSLRKYGTWIPPKPTSLSFIADENGITAAWSCDLTNVYGSVQFEVKTYYDGIARGTPSGQQVVLVKTATYQFSRAVDGFPEKPGTAGMKIGTLTLDKYSVIVNAVNITSGSRSESDEEFCDYSKYRTWIPAAPSISSRVSNRNITLYFSQPANCYGVIQYLVGVRRYDDAFDTFYVPDLESNPYARESAYKLQVDGVFVIGKTESESQFTQTMPLETQNGIQGMLDVDESEDDNRIFAANLDPSVKGWYDGANFYEDEEHTARIIPSDSRMYFDNAEKKYYKWNGSDYILKENYGSLLILGLGGYAPIDTPYQFEAYSYNKTVEDFYDSLLDTNHNYDKDTYHKVSVEGTRRQSTALATSVQDVLNGSIVSDKVGVGAITETKIEDDAISSPKIQANAVIARNIFAYNLLTLTEGAHSISGYAYNADTDEEVRKILDKIKSGIEKSSQQPLINRLDEITKEKSNNYWIGLDTDSPEFYMGNMKVADKWKDDANYFHYYKENGETNLDIKLSNFIVTAVTSTIKGFFNVRNKKGAIKYTGANSFLQVNPESENFEEDTVKGYYDSSSDSFYEDSAFTKKIEPDGTVVFIDKATDKAYRYNTSSEQYIEIQGYKGITNPETMVLRGDFLIDRKNSDETNGTLTVRGLSKLSGGLRVGEEGSLAESHFYGKLTAHEGLQVGSAGSPKTATVYGSLTVSKDQNGDNGHLTVEATSTLFGTLTVGTSDKNSDTTLNGSLTVSALATLNDELKVPNKLTTLHSLKVTNGTTLKGTLSVTELATMSGGIKTNTIVAISGSLTTVNNSLTVNGTLKGSHIVLPSSVSNPQEGEIWIA